MKRLNILGAQAAAMALPVCLLQSPWKNKENQTAMHLDSICVVEVSKRCCTWAFSALPAPDGLGFWAAGRNESVYVKQGPGLDSAACETRAAISTLLHKPRGCKLPQMYYLRGVASACAKRLRPECQQVTWWGCGLHCCGLQLCTPQRHLRAFAVPQHCNIDAALRGAAAALTISITLCRGWMALLSAFPLSGPGSAPL